MDAMDFLGNQELLARLGHLGMDCMDHQGLKEFQVCKIILYNFINKISIFSFEQFNLGEKGEDGKDGRDGSDGTDGKDGTNGGPGPAGNIKKL
jgi:hypothetical protein